MHELATLYQIQETPDQTEPTKAQAIHNSDNKEIAKEQHNKEWMEIQIVDKSGKKTIKEQLNKEENTTRNTSKTTTKSIKYDTTT